MTLQVKLFPGDATGCGFYRMLEPMRVLKDSGHDIEFEVVMNDADPGALEVELGGRMGELHITAVKDPECDVLVLQRPASRHLAEAIPFVQAHGTAVVCEYDDDFDTIHQRNPAWRAYEPHLSPESNKVWAKLCADLADLVTVSTPRLQKRYGAHGACQVLPNYVPAWYLDVEAKSAHDLDIVIGWTGFSRTHAPDLPMVGNALRKILEDGQARFHGIGDAKMLKGLGLEPLRQSRVQITNWVENLEDYPAAVKGAMDLGIVPLADITFNQSKSWIKGLEFAALGIPFVASPVAAYRDLYKLGVGDLVGTTTANTGAWYRALVRYLDDPEYAALRAEEGRIQASEMTYENQGERWLGAWSAAVSLASARGT